MTFMEDITTSIKWIDLGLSVLWANCNVGATKPEEYGDYFAWGEVAPKNIYNEETYLFKKNFFKINKYKVPTLKQYHELIDECTWKWTNDYNGTGVAGQIVTSKTNDNHIFLPSAGYRYDSDLKDAVSYGYYWSSSITEVGSDFACSLYFGSGLVCWHYNYRFYGRPVRLIKNK